MKRARRRTCLTDDRVLNRDYERAQERDRARLDEIKRLEQEHTEMVAAKNRADQPYTRPNA